MELESLSEEAFIVNADDSISQVVSGMIKRGKPEALVFDQEFKGVLTLDDVVKRRVSDPNKTRASYFMRPVRPFPADADVSDAINYMMASEYSFLPVRSDGKIRVIPKPKLLGFVKDAVFEGKKAKDVMTFPYCASEGDDIKTVISIMRDTGVPRIPILSSSGSFMGLADSLSLAEIVADRFSPKRGARFGDKTKLGEIGIGKFTRSDILKVGPETELKKVVKSMQGRGLFTVIVEEGGRFLGIITARDIFKLIGKSLETVYTRVSGLDEEDNFVKAKIDEMIENSVSKLLKLLSITYVAIHVETHRKGGKRTKYSVQGRFSTEKGNFFASDVEWEPTKAVKMFLEKIEREIQRKIGKTRNR